MARSQDDAQPSDSELEPHTSADPLDGTTISIKKTQCGPKLQQLRDSAWQLDEATFINYFGEESLVSYPFLELLVKLSNNAPLSEALRLLEDNRELRLSSKEPRADVSSKKSWQPHDVSQALEILESRRQVSSPQSSSATSNKRKRDQAEEDYTAYPEAPLEARPARTLSPEREITKAGSTQDGDLDISDMGFNSTMLESTTMSLDDATRETITIIASPAPEMPTPPPTHRRSSLSSIGDSLSHSALATLNTDIRSSMPTTDKAGALSSLTEKAWLSATCVDLLLNIFKTEGFKILDHAFVCIENPQHFDNKQLRVKDDESVVIQSLLVSDHWTVAFIDLKTGIVHHLDSLRMEASSMIPAVRQAALERLTKLLSRDKHLRHLKWTFVAKECPKQDNTYDCGVYMLVSILHHMAGLPQPQSINAGVWRRAFRATLGDNAVNENTAASSHHHLNAKIFDAIPVGKTDARYVLGADYCSRTHAAIDEQFTQLQQAFQHARETFQHTRATHSLISRFVENAEQALRKLGRSKSMNNQTLEFHRDMRLRVEEWKKKLESYADSDSDSHPLTNKLEDETRPYFKQSEAIGRITSTLTTLEQDEQKTRYRRDSLLAARTPMEAERDVRASETTRLEEEVKSASAELKAFYKAQILACQTRLQSLQKVPL
ncbi:hypothetical protein W97_07738 [Coniosporium apollinis CBS 100218]|uniref:Ubiquitin-like protease family profile domain-containing protein n=1 Tax=Coniosporium apollinis (strain CBS 100218) TaxID=1168221 RepID=R7Z305_CONA1|nr:uncharacterized protein W97_07738 [Coniosporium apollinis CBS 100218]EON68414.1 hypothetical protein W97_07738 [Coniosporium apollinis CBS 100218]